MKKLLIISLVFGVTCIAKAQDMSGISEILDKLEKNHKTDKEYDKFSLEGKKFFIIKEKSNQSQKNIIEFLPNNQINLIKISENKQTGETLTEIYNGDVVRNHNSISVRGDHLDNKKIPVPMVYNLLLNYYKGYWYLVDINTGEKWLETHYLDKKK